MFNALNKFADDWKDMHVVIFSDNTQVVSMINRRISDNKFHMDLLRDMFFYGCL